MERMRPPTERMGGSEQKEAKTFDFAQGREAIGRGIG
jgi:hypothetical protein